MISVDSMLETLYDASLLLNYLLPEYPDLDGDIREGCRIVNKLITTLEEKAK